VSPSPYLPDDVAEADPDDSQAEEDRRDADRRVSTVIRCTCPGTLAERAVSLDDVTGMFCCGRCDRALQEPEQAAAQDELPSCRTGGECGCPVEAAMICHSQFPLPTTGEDL
jgi:hypothetical protein